MLAFNLTTRNPSAVQLELISGYMDCLCELNKRCIRLEMGEGCRVSMAPALGSMALWDSLCLLWLSGSFLNCVLLGFHGDFIAWVLLKQKNKKLCKSKAGYKGYSGMTNLGGAVQEAACRILLHLLLKGMK
jgi:hypothetical protein